MLFQHFIKLFDPKLKKFIAGRRLGKTYESIKWCSKNAINIITHSRQGALDIRGYIDMLKESMFMAYDINIYTIDDIKKGDRGLYFIDEINLFEVADLVYLLNTVDIVGYNGTFPEFRISHFKKRSPEDIKKLNIKNVLF